MVTIALFITSLIAVLSCQSVDAVPVSTHVKTVLNGVHHPIGHTVKTVTHALPHPYFPFGGLPYGDISGAHYGAGFYGMPATTSVNTVSHGFQPPIPMGAASVSHTTHGVHQPIVPYGGFYGGLYGSHYPGAAFNYPLGLGYGLGGLYGGLYGFNYPGAATVSQTTHGVHPAGLGYGLGIYGAAPVPATHAVTHTTHGLPQFGFGWNY